jgi:surface antigen
MSFKTLKRKLTFVLSLAACIGMTAAHPSALLAEGEEGGEWGGETVTYTAVNPYYGGWSNCTWSAWQLCYDHTGIALPRFGNAGAWYGNAPGFGYSVGTAPAAMSIIVWSNHVGFVTEVSEDGSMVYIKEGGYCGGYHEGWWPSQGGRNGQAFYGYVYTGSGGQVIQPTQIVTTTTTYDEATGETVETQTITTAGAGTVIEFPEVSEEVVRVDDAAKEETVKREDLDAKKELQKEDKQQREAATAITTKLLCE